MSAAACAACRWVPPSPTAARAQRFRGRLGGNTESRDGKLGNRSELQLLACLLPSAMGNQALQQLGGRPGGIRLGKEQKEKKERGREHRYGREGGTSRMACRLSGSVPKRQAQTHWRQLAHWRPAHGPPGAWAPGSPSATAHPAGSRAGVGLGLQPSRQQHKHRYSVTGKEETRQ